MVAATASPEVKGQIAEFLKSLAANANAPLVTRPSSGVVTLTNLRTHVVNLFGDSLTDEAIHLLPRVPHKTVPDHFLTHPMVQAMLAAGDMVQGVGGADPKAVAIASEISFADPEGTKQRIRASRKATEAADPVGEVPPPPAVAPAPVSGAARKPWET